MEDLGESGMSFGKAADSLDVATIAKTAKSG
jgi:hypothetical protein